jgi:hypothetical protein
VQSDDEDAVRETVRAYAEAVEREEYDVACGLLCRMGQAIVIATAAATGFQGRSCELAMSHLIRDQPRPASPRAADFVCDVISIEGDHARVVLTTAEPQLRTELPLVREDGSWKIGVSDSPSVTADRDPEQAVRERFVTRTRDRMVELGWEVIADPDEEADDTSVWLGDFQRSLDSDFVAIVRFVIESIEISAGVRRRHVSPEIMVGGEVGVCHRPTARLIELLEVGCGTDISCELGTLAAPGDDTTPSMSSVLSADRASQTLVELVDRHALGFAREHGSVDAMVAFLAGGGQVDRDEEFGFMFIPALLAASGRGARAGAALAEFRQRPRQHVEDQESYDHFARQLVAWLSKAK